MFTGNSPADTRALDFVSAFMYMQDSQTGSVPQTGPIPTNRPIPQTGLKFLMNSHKWADFPPQLCWKPYFFPTSGPIPTTGLKLYVSTTNRPILCWQSCDVTFPEWHQSQIEKKTSGTGDHYTADAALGIDSGPQQLHARTQAMPMS